MMIILWLCSCFVVWKAYVTRRVKGYVTDLLVYEASGGGGSNLNRGPTRVQSFTVLYSNYVRRPSLSPRTSVNVCTIFISARSRRLLCQQHIPSPFALPQPPGVLSLLVIALVPSFWALSFEYAGRNGGSKANRSSSWFLSCSWDMSRRMWICFLSYFVQSTNVSISWFNTTWSEELLLGEEREFESDFIGNACCCRGVREFLLVAHGILTWGDRQAFHISSWHFRFSSFGRNFYPLVWNASISTWCLVFPLPFFICAL